jgi:hypothetical protein
MILDIRDSAEKGCPRCKIIWDGISKTKYAGTNWSNAVSFCLTITAGGSKWLRVGIKDFGVGDLGLVREWVDFYGVDDKGEQCYSRF